MLRHTEAELLIAFDSLSLSGEEPRRIEILFFRPSKEWASLWSQSTNEWIDHPDQQNPIGRRIEEVVAAKEAFVIADEEMETAGHYNSISGLIFGPDSKHVSYVAKVDNKSLVVIGEKEGKYNDTIFGEGKIVFDSSASLHFLGLKGNSIYLAEKKIGAFHKTQFRRPLTANVGHQYAAT